MPLKKKMLNEHALFGEKVHLKSNKITVLRAVFLRYFSSDMEKHVTKKSDMKHV